MKSIIQKRLISFLLSFSFILSLCACEKTDELKDLVDLKMDPPSREQIDASRVGVNNFFTNSRFGSIATQYETIQHTLRLNYVRILIACTDDVQSGPNASPDMSFFDNVIASVPSGVDILVVVAHAPNWMTNSGNWIDGNPRKTWTEKWFRTVVARYANNPRIIGWEIWNEPDLTVVSADAALGLTSPSNYLELVQFAAPIVRSLDPTKLVVMAATQSIQQNFPVNLDYNISLRDLGIEGLVDIYNIHYYGEQFENIIRDGGVADFLNGISIPIWITESGAMGPTNQLAYVETAWPYLQKEINGIDRIYYYEFGSTQPLETNYGLLTSDASFPVSDLYVHLRDR